MRPISAKSAGTPAIARATAPANENLHGAEGSDAPITNHHPDDPGGCPPVVADVDVEPVDFMTLLEDPNWDAAPAVGVRVAEKPDMDLDEVIDAAENDDRQKQPG